VDMWICGYVDMWICGYVDMWICGFVDLSGPLSQNKTSLKVTDSDKHSILLQYVIIYGREHIIAQVPRLINSSSKHNKLDST
jgi:hypothetical protein